MTTIGCFDLDLDYLEHFPSLIQAVTRQGVQGVVRQYLKPNHGALVILADMDQVEMSGLSLHERTITVFCSSCRLRVIEHEMYRNCGNPE